MKSNLLTSTITALILPWFYFVFVDVTPMNIYDNGVLVHEANQAGGISSLIEFYGLGRSLLIYAKVAAIVFVFSFLVCNLNQFIRSKIETEL